MSWFSPLQFSYTKTLLCSHHYTKQMPVQLVNEQCTAPLHCDLKRNEKQKWSCFLLSLAPQPALDVECKWSMTRPPWPCSSFNEILHHSFSCELLPTHLRGNLVNAPGISKPQAPNYIVGLSGASPLLLGKGEMCEQPLSNLLNDLLINLISLILDSWANYQNSWRDMFSEFKQSSMLYGFGILLLYR